MFVDRHWALRVFSALSLSLSLSSAKSVSGCPALSPSRSQLQFLLCAAISFRFSVLAFSRKLRLTKDRRTHTERERASPRVCRFGSFLLLFRSQKRAQRTLCCSGDGLRCVRECERDAKVRSVARNACQSVTKISKTTKATAAATTTTATTSSLMAFSVWRFEFRVCV